jgi:hypothetical protein
MNWDKMVTFMPYGKLFMRHRKLLKLGLHGVKIGRYNHVHLQEAHTLVKNLLADPENYIIAINW